MAYSIKMNSYLKIPLAVCIAATFLTAGVVSYALLQGGDKPASGGLLRSFSSYDELSEFVGNSSYMGGGNAYYGSDESGIPRETMSGGSNRMSYSTTNVQVAGVDEQDTVKTDGEYLFLASYDCVSIVHAYPPDQLANVTQLDAQDLLGYDLANVSIYVSGLYLYNDKLVVLFNEYEWQSWSAGGSSADYYMRSWGAQKAMVSVFDISDVTSPQLIHSVGVTGYGLTTRMIDSYVYYVVESVLVVMEDGPLVPQTWDGHESRDIPVEDLKYDPDSQDNSMYLSILAVDVLTGQSDRLSMLAGYASTVYMSTSAMYVTFQKWSGAVIAHEIGMGPTDEWSARTTVYKISVDKLSMTDVARGDVKGWVLNQFSMDEKGDQFRVATTTAWTDPESCVTVLDNDLKDIGVLDGLAPDERIFAARFVGDTLYLVTFRQIDPLFVIDLSNPEKPKVVGQLDIPGFSSYLHPIDETHVLGIGQQNSMLKVSLFDVSDPANPVEQSKFVIDDYKYSYSPALSDHKALVFDPERGLLMLPVTASTYDWIDSTTYGLVHWTGTFVFNVSTADGISLVGRAPQGTYDQVNRVLYIGDTVYAISTTFLKAFSLSDLSYQGMLVYYTPSWWPNGYPIAY